MRKMGFICWSGAGRRTGMGSSGWRGNVALGRASVITLIFRRKEDKISKIGIFINNQRLVGVFRRNTYFTVCSRL